MENKQARIKELVEVLNKAAYAYEQENREIISNLEYDRLYDELCSLEEETGIKLANSPTSKVGYEVLSDLPKERHEEPMLSLDKTKEREVLRDWLNEKEGVLSWKMDGLTIVLTYKDGKLYKAVTRGNGEIGEVVTNNAKVFKNIPLAIPYKGELILRGEAVIRYSDFEKINEQIEDAEARYKNPRNLCSGAVRQLSNEITAKRNVNFFAFALIRTDSDVAFSTVKEQFDWLRKQGFEVVEEKVVTKDNIIDVIEEYAQKIVSNDFPSDGLVLTYNDIQYGASLGRTSKFPRNAIAFKWRDELRTTKLLYIEWSASRTGLINPIAVFEPVELEGTTVSRASLHNISIMEELEIAEGDEISVYKANMIIPQIADNFTRSGVKDIPTVCPVCGEKTIIKEDNAAKVLFCPNKNCLAKKIKSFTHFVTRDAMNIDGLSEATIEKFVDLGIVKEPADLFKLNEHRDKITVIEGFGERSFKNILASIEKARNTEAARVLYSLGIPNIGLSNARLICKKYSDDFSKIISASAEDLTEIDGIGGVIADSVVNFFAVESNKKILDEILKEVNIIKTEVSDFQPLKDKVFVITGSVEHFANRNELKTDIENKGGKVTGSVTSKTDYLINNDNTSQSSKNKKAKELNVSIITEEEYIELASKDNTNA